MVIVNFSRIVVNASAQTIDSVTFRTTKLTKIKEPYAFPVVSARRASLDWMYKWCKCHITCYTPLYEASIALNVAMKLKSNLRWIATVYELSIGMKMTMGF